MFRASAKRFLLVTGKGGVGKTTVAAALAVGIARAGRRTLVVASSANTQLALALGTELDGKPRRVSDGLHGMLIDPEESMREYVESAMGSRWVADALFHERFSRGFLHGLPGLRAWALLGKAWFQQELDERTGEAPFDTVLLDAPATGDSTDILRVPRIISDLAPFGRLRRDAEACWAMLRDAERSAIVPVCLPEELPVRETEELVALVRKDLGLPFGPLVVNQWTSPRFSADASSALVDATFEGVPASLLGVLRAGQRHARRERSENEERERLALLELEICAVPRLAKPPVGLRGSTEVLEHLASSFGLAR
ncbi:MAG TPA: ArsA family ATPase [Polyangiaceae bacterium]|nr:ArsA family ATPase [Polyangiaceae bacterium]